MLIGPDSVEVPPPHPVMPLRTDRTKEDVSEGRRDEQYSQRNMYHVDNLHGQGALTMSRPQHCSGTVQACPLVDPQVQALATFSSSPQVLQT